MPELARRVRRRLLVPLLAAGLLLLPPASASAERVVSFDVPSPLIDTSAPGGKLRDKRTVPKVNVLLPDGYKKRGTRRYPVLFLFHGATLGADDWLKYDDPRPLLDRPAIVVMADGGLYGFYMDWWNGGRRSGPAWASYHLNLLRRTIEQRFRIRPARRWHAIAGISMGGQGRCATRPCGRATSAPRPGSRRRSPIPSHPSCS